MNTVNSVTLQAVGLVIALAAAGGRWVPTDGLVISQSLNVTISYKYVGNTCTLTTMTAAARRSTGVRRHNITVRTENTLVDTLCGRWRDPFLRVRICRLRPKQSLIDFRGLLCGPRQTCMSVFGSRILVPPLVHLLQWKMYSLLSDTNTSGLMRRSEATGLRRATTSCGSKIHASKIV